MQVSIMQSDDRNKEVARPKARFKPTLPEKSCVDGGASTVSLVCNMLIRWRISLLTIEKTIPMYLFTTTGLLIDFWSSLLSRFNSFRHDVLC